MNHKLVGILLIIVLVFAVSGCSSGNGNNSAVDDSQQEMGNALEQDLGDFDSFQEDLDSLGEIDIDELDF